jgi:hypothetical protein
VTLPNGGSGIPQELYETSGATAVFEATLGPDEGTLTVTIDGSVDPVAADVYRVTLESESSGV